MSTANPFALATTRSSNTALADANRDKQVAEIQSQMVIAKRFPRDPIAAVDRILNACTRPTLAESALYSYSRGGSDVTGPSIRLAEALAQSWGNIDCGVREVEQANGVSTMESYATDLESNYRVSKVFTVPHFRYTKAGTKKLEDPRDIYELTANQGARRLRACILSVIPGDVVEAAVKQCETTLHASADINPDAIKKMADVFGGLGVTKAQLEARIQRRLESIQPAQVVQLKKIFASLRDGMSGVADWFPVIASQEEQDATTRTEAIKAKLKAKQPEPPPESEPVMDLATVLKMVAEAFTRDELKASVEAAKLLTIADQKIAHDAYKARVAEIKAQQEAEAAAMAEPTGQTVEQWQAELGGEANG
jgi:hypothetical protein